MIDMLAALFAHKTRALTLSEIEAVIDQFAPADLADVFDSRAALAQMPGGLDLVAGETANAVYKRCEPIINEIVRLATGRTREEVKATSFVVKAASAHQALLATYPGLTFDQAVERIVHLALARTVRTSALLSNNTQRH
ncbi:hypothetical protein QTL95_10220 [Rhizobium sp. S152]|uniref:hypothetical protein n=1 Tax=Rhizobium sp. S152 TaxID=3055038 RepID=UPI0025A98E19|nr:hypothetical protein [Rhizobium sp. S152]MDM9626273.1 hypothetical protein [Rhizobium sp. S152]